ncbi:MAG: hypothetical protein R2682_02330 [Pyrinomonadaceae bacterium]
MAKTDSEGHYQIYVGEGRYRIHADDCGWERDENCISPDQQLEIDARDRINHNVFDITLVHRSEDVPVVNQTPKGN